jgi:serine/threonine-protein kinase
MAQHAAQKVGAKAYLFGTMTGKTAPYTIRIDLLNATSNDVMSSVEEKVATRLEIPAAIDHLATRLREDAGEDGGSIAAASNSLDREATGNVDALHMLALGDDAVDSGRLMEALRIYQQAAGIDPKCVQVQLRLAVLYRRLRAETASAEAAKQAVAAAENAGERVRSMAQYEYEMNASGDYTQAAAILRKLVETSPHDSVALSSLSRTLRLEGRFAEALQIAQQVYTADPFYVDAYTQAQNALIGLDRYEAAEQLEAQIQRLGLGNPGGALTAAYLEGRQDLVDSAVAAITAPSTTFRVDWSFGLYLDNVGQLAAGSVLWQGHAARAQQIKGLDSTAAFLLSQGALDRALMGECTAGETMARESDAHSQGMMALFHSGMAHALCGNTSAAREIAGRLEQDYPQGFMQRGFFGADIRAAIALHDHDPAAALELLKPARQFDLISPTPVLRGRANVALGHTQIGIVDFQTVLSHRGVPFMVGSVVYPVAQIGVARAFADTGDVGNSAEAYRRFVELWRTADGNQAMLVEARAHSK